MPDVRPDAFPPSVLSPGYLTQLDPLREAAFLSWVGKNKVPFDPSPKADYDMRGFWAALQQRDPRAVSAVDPDDGRMHYPDYWKTPYHESFSNESKFARSNAPEWVGNVLRDQGTGEARYEPHETFDELVRQKLGPLSQPEPQTPSVLQQLLGQKSP